MAGPQTESGGRPLQTAKTFSEVKRLEHADKHSGYPLMPGQTPAEQRPAQMAPIPSGTSALGGTC